MFAIKGTTIKRLHDGQADRDKTLIEKVFVVLNVRSSRLAISKDVNICDCPSHCL